MAEETASTKACELEDLRTATTTTIKSLEIEIVSRETAARADATAQAEASWRMRLEESNKAKETAEAQTAEITAGLQARLMSSAQRWRGQRTTLSTARK